MVKKWALIFFLGFPNLIYFCEKYSSYAQTMLGCSLLDIITKKRKTLTKSDVAELGLQFVFVTLLTLQVKRLEDLHS